MGPSSATSATTNRWNGKELLALLVEFSSSPTTTSTTIASITTKSIWIELYCIWCSWKSRPLIIPSRWISIHGTTNSNNSYNCFAFKGNEQQHAIAVLLPIKYSIQGNSHLGISGWWSYITSLSNYSRWRDSWSSTSGWFGWSRDVSPCSRDSVTGGESYYNFSGAANKLRRAVMPARTYTWRVYTLGIHAYVHLL